DWDASENIPQIETALNASERSLCYHQARFNRLTLSDLTWCQWKRAYNHDDYVVVNGEKNVSGCILQDRLIHNTKGVDEHLGNRAVYQPLTKAHAYNKYRVLRYQVIAWLSCHQDLSLSKPEWTYLHESIHRYPDKLACFHMTPQDLTRPTTR
ncbi:LOW QUALITY PROTEIN: hypothetical protein ACHAWF_014663, partial [Thalassiosira exigua]